VLFCKHSDPSDFELFRYIIWGCHRLILLLMSSTLRRLSFLLILDVCPLFILSVILQDKQKSLNMGEFDHCHICMD